MKHTLLRQAPFLLILAVAAAGFFLARPWLSFENLAAHQETLTALVAQNYLAAAAAFVAAYILIVAFSLPGATLATLTGGFLFGLFPGVVFNIAAAATGAVLIFLAARMGFGERLAARVDASQGAAHRIKLGLDANQWSVLFLIRLVPVVPFFVANVLPALLNVPLWRYVVTTALGIIPGALVYTSVGAGLGEVLAAGAQPDLGIIFAPHVLGPLLGLVALAALPIVIKAFRKGAAA